MRYSPDQPVEAQVPVSTSADNRAFFEKIAESIRPAAFRGALLLIGASDHRALAVRRAQAALRYDRRASAWSHAALLVAWPGTSDAAVGVEVTLDPESLQAPERNGVTVFPLKRYFDAVRYPNVAIVIPSFTAEAAKRGGADAIVDAALNPNRERPRFPLWDGLAAWARYTYAPDSTPNPLLANVPLPAAALCEYAYAAAGVDLTPGATADQACPELLWATLRRWSTRLAEVQGTVLKTFVVRRDRVGAPMDRLGSVGDDPLLLPVLAKPKRARGVRAVRAGLRKRR